MKSSISAVTLLTILASCLAALMGSVPVASAQSVSRREVEVHIFSGRPNPVFTLTRSEGAEVRQLLAGATDAPAKVDADSQAKKPETPFASKLGYRGLSIREYAADGTLLSNTDIAGQKVLVRAAGRQHRKVAASDDLERRLVDLALTKGAISEELHGHILKEMQSGAADGPR
jgi:hypothetical protein